MEIANLTAAKLTFLMEKLPWGERLDVGAQQMPGLAL
jgi:hypothetical protein